MTQPTTQPIPPPHELRVERGAPDDAELAAVVAVLLTVLTVRARLAAAADAEPARPRARWSLPAPYAAPGSWVA